MSCISLKHQGRRTVVDAHCFRPQDFLLAALASLLFSKIFWLPSLENETCRSCETCDYDFFQPKPLSIFVLKCFASLFSGFYRGIDALGFTFPSITPCSRSLPRCQVTFALSNTFPRADPAWFGWVFCLYILKMKALKGFSSSLTGQRALCILHVNFKVCIANLATFSALVCAAFPCQGS